MNLFLEEHDMKRKLMIVLGAAFMLLSFAGCRKERAAGSPAGAPLETIRVVLDWTPNTNHTGLYVALEQGWFAEEGFAVSIIQPPEDGALLLTASGGAEFGVDFQESLGPAIARNEDALPLVAVAAIISHNTSGIMSLSQSGVGRPRDLAGRRVAFWETPLVIEVLRSIVEGDGGDFAAVNLIPNSATDAFSALQTDVDAIWVYYAWDGIAAQTRGVEMNYLDLGSLNPVFDFYTPILAANKHYAEANPEKIQKFLRAVSRGYAFAAENPALAADILLKHAPELDGALVRASQDYLASRYQGDAPRWGEIDAERWGRFYRWMYERGLLETDIRSGGFTNEFLPHQE
jgi:ABC-type nitrate/sulfonate/bicarbonate transport system substrate-binding protein